MRSGQDVRKLAGRYELRAEIARGGMGVVWRAEDTVLGRPVAVKEVFPPPAGRNGDRTSAQRRVLREARAAAALHHPGIVTVFDVVQEGDKGFIVMELAESPSLEAVVQEHGPLPVPRAIDVAREAAEILRQAHAHGITHRDVKPGNVLLTPSGRVKLADFGISSIEGDPGMTTSRDALGSPAYMSPEQARGERTGPETDLWGLGALLYFAVEGVPPFDGGQPIATLNAVVHGDPRPMRRAAGLAPLISELLSKEPSRRPSEDELERMLANAAQAADDVWPLVETFAGSPREHGQTAEATPFLVPGLEGPSSDKPPTEEPAARRSRRRVAVAAAVVAALLIAGAVGFVNVGGRNGPLPVQSGLGRRDPTAWSGRTATTSPTVHGQRAQPSPLATPAPPSQAGGANHAPGPNKGTSGHDNGPAPNGGGAGGAPDPTTSPAPTPTPTPTQSGAGPTPVPSASA